MKVLKKGRAQTGWSMQMKCSGNGNEGGGCGALLLIEQGDVFRSESHALNETDVYQTFQCPECFVMTDFTKPVPFEIPKNLNGWKAAKDRAEKAANKAREKKANAEET